MSIIPLGPVGFKVFGLGRTPDGFPLLNLQVNTLGIFHFTKIDGQWKDHNNEILNNEEQQMMEKVWASEKNKYGLEAL